MIDSPRMLVAVGAIAAVLAVARDYEARIASVESRTIALDRESQRDERASADSLREARARRGVSPERDGTRRVARYLAFVEGACSRHGSSLSAIRPLDNGNASEPAFGITVRGRFPDLVALIGDISRSSIPARVDGARFSIADGENGKRVQVVIPLIIAGGNVAPPAGLWHVKAGNDAVSRDPFESREPNAPRGAPTEGVLPLEALPPNAGALHMPIGSSMRLLGVVVGARRRALIEGDGSTQIVGTGDRIGTRTVVEIRGSSVRFDDGTTLDIDSEKP